jgi:hypothetical protein
MLIYSQHEGLPSVQTPPCERRRNREATHVTYWRKQIHRFPLIAPSWKRSAVKIGDR